MCIRDRIEAQCQKVKQAIEELTEGDSLDELIVEWKKYGDMIGPHMDEEEATALLLLRAYFKPEDLKPVIEYIQCNAKRPQNRNGQLHLLHGCGDISKGIYGSREDPLICVVH